MNPNVTLRIGPERTFMPGALQPFMFAAGKRLVVTATVPPGTVFPGVYGTMTSDDHGETWQPWRRDDIEGGSPFFEGCATTRRDGTAMLVPHCFNGPDAGGNWKATLWESRDDWKNVTPFEATLHLPQAKGGFDDDGHPAGAVFVHRTLLEAKNGDLLLTAYSWFHGDDTPSTYRPTMKKFRTILLRSADRGRTWSLVSTVAVDPSVGEEGFNEPAMVQLKPRPRAGRLIIHLRTGSNKTFPHCPIYQCQSDDEGKTWTKPHALPFENVDPDILEMQSGLLVAAYGYRTPESRVNLTSVPKTIGPAHGNYVAFSHDQGQTWVQPTRVTADPSTCYPAVHEIAPGKLLFVYDIGDAWQHVWIGREKIERSLGSRVIEVGV